MLDALRRGSTGWVAKILLSLLILSFAVWGIADVITGFGRGALATVGETEITATEFNRVYRNELESLSIQNERRITAEEARREGVDRLVLSKMIGQAALREHANALNLGLSTEQVVEGLRNDPDFAGPDGKFSRTGFNDLLSRLDLSEAGFLQLRREDELRQQLSTAILSSTVVPKEFLKINNAYNNETRTIEFFKMDASKITVSEPDEAKIKAYYEENKQDFMRPEYRKFSVLVASTEDLKKEVQVSDEDLKASYEADKDSYDTPERRRVQQIAFKDKAAAEAAREALVKGSKNFMDVAKEQGATEKDVNLGMLSKPQLIDPKIADIVFKLERDAISDVTEGRFATVLLRVIEIEPGRKSTFEETKNKVRDKIAATRAATLLQEKADLVEEGRNAGKSLKDLASELKLKHIDVAASDQSGKTPEGTTALDGIPTPERITRLVFRTEPGTETEPVELGSDAYAWLDVQGKDPTREKPFEEVKDAAKAAWLDAERGRLVKEAADKFVERLKAGEDLAKVAADAGGTPDKVEDVKRNLVPPGLTQEAVETAFAQPLNGAASALTVDRGTRTVMKVTKITPAGDLPKADADKLVTDLRQDLQNDLLIAYVSQLQNNLGVHVDETEFKRVTGADTAQ